ncbi:hypothetical protein BHE74_00016032 [Ensete ventricosum]|nr:hypothetical protein BHE74_00016032 [Ensete ventricosum]
MVEIDLYQLILGCNGGGKQPQSMVPPGSGWFAYRSTSGPVRTAQYGRYSSVLQTLVFNKVRHIGPYQRTEFISVWYGTQYCVWYCPVAGDPHTGQLADRYVSPGAGPYPSVRQTLVFNLVPYRYIKLCSVRYIIVYQARTGILSFAQYDTVLCIERYAPGYRAVCVK